MESPCPFGTPRASKWSPRGASEVTFGTQDAQIGALWRPSGDQNWHFGAYWEHLKSDIDNFTNVSSFWRHFGAFVGPKWGLQLRKNVSNSDVRNTCNALCFLSRCWTILWRIMCLHRSSGPLVRSVNTDVSLRSAMAVQSDGLLEIHSFFTSNLTLFWREVGSVCRLFELILSA